MTNTTIIVDCLHSEIAGGRRIYNSETKQKQYSFTVPSVNLYKHYLMNYIAARLVYLTNVSLLAIQVSILYSCDKRELPEISLDHLWMIPPGAASGNNAIFSGKSLHQEAFKFLPAVWPE